MRIDSPKMTNVIATGSFTGSFTGEVIADNNILSGSLGSGGGTIVGIGGEGTDTGTAASSVTLHGSTSDSTGILKLTRGGTDQFEIYETSNIAALQANSGNVIWLIPNGDTDATVQVTTGGHIVPASAVQDLGSVTNPWRDIYLSTGSLLLGKKKFSVTSTGAVKITDSDTGAPGEIEAGQVTVSGSNGSVKLGVDANGNLTTENASGTPSLGTYSGSFSGSLQGIIDSVSFTDAAAIRTSLSVLTSASIAASVTSSVETLSGSAHTDRVAKVAVLSGSAHTRREEISASLASTVDTNAQNVAKTNIDNSFSGEQTFVDVTITGTGSFAYLSSVGGDIKTIGDAYIVLNADTPAQRYSGLRVYDSGSVNATGSLEYDSVSNHWFYESTVEDYASVLLAGPEAARGALTVIGSGSMVAGYGGNHVGDAPMTATQTDITVASGTNFTVSEGKLKLGSTAVTSTAAELNILDGVTATTAELNFVDGVTSNIQTQLDAKAASSALTSHTGDTNNPHSVTATQVGLGNVTNESKATMFTSPTFTGTVSGVTATHVGLGTTADVQFDSLGIGTAAPGTTGVIRATNDIIAYYSSDERLKDNFKPLTGALDKVKLMGGYEFDWNSNQDVHEGHDIGVKAQEVQAQYPELVHERDNGYLAVDYVKLTAVLLEAVKELSAKVDELSK